MTSLDGTAILEAFFWEPIVDTPSEGNLALSLNQLGVICRDLICTIDNAEMSDEFYFDNHVALLDIHYALCGVQYGFGNRAHQPTRCNIQSWLSFRQLCRTSQSRTQSRQTWQELLDRAWYFRYPDPVAVIDIKFALDHLRHGLQNIGTYSERQACAMVMEKADDALFAVSGYIPLCEHQNTLKTRLQSLIIIAADNDKHDELLTLLNQYAELENL